MEVYEYSFSMVELFNFRLLVPRTLLSRYLLQCLMMAYKEPFNLLQAPVDCQASFRAIQSTASYKA